MKCSYLFVILTTYIQNLSNLLVTSPLKLRFWFSVLKCHLSSFLASSIDLLVVASYVGESPMIDGIFLSMPAHLSSSSHIAPILHLFLAEEHS